MEKFWGENVRSTSTSITSGCIESTESHVIVGGGVAVCLLLSAHRAVSFAFARLSCFVFAQSTLASSSYHFVYLNSLECYNHFHIIICSVGLCQSVCLSVLEHISLTTCPIFIYTRSVAVLRWGQGAQAPSRQILPGPQFFSG